MKILGFVPARMAASRFPGKPLHKIAGRPMVEHVFLRAQLFSDWDDLYLTTCDDEIFQFGLQNGFKSIMTRDDHVRCLDRVAEAVSLCDQNVGDDDVIVCVQGDEPMLHPEMIENVVKPLLNDANINGTVLSMEIVDEEQFLNPDIVKLVFNSNYEILYTSRSPIPHCPNGFDKSIGIFRVGGIFAFRWKYLQEFVQMGEGRLEKLESCDSNRFLDSKKRQYAAVFKNVPYFSVDSPEDVIAVENGIKNDPLWGKY